MLRIFYLMFGGAVGALLRFGVSGLVHRFFSAAFPWGTMTVNLAGSFLAGFFWSISEHFTISPNVRIFLMIGLLGAFTTFSTFSLENFHLLRDGEIRLCIINVMVNNILGLAFVFAGFYLVRFFLKP